MADRSILDRWGRRRDDGFWHAYGPLVGAALVAILFALVAKCAGTPDDGSGYLRIESEISDPAVRPPAAAGSAPSSVTVATVDPGPVVGPVPGTPSGVGPVATVTGSAERGVQVAVGPPPTPPAATSPARVVPFPGDCVSWSGEFVARGATADEIRFFFAGGIIERESGCGRDTLNDATGDTGVCQLNPVHNRAGWFGGREFGPGGWLLELHGLRTWEDTDSTEWVDACLTLFRVCGPGPWRLGDWGCANRRLP